MAVLGYISCRLDHADNVLYKHIAKYKKTEGFSWGNFQSYLLLVVSLGLLLCRVYWLRHLWLRFFQNENRFVMGAPEAA